MEKIRGAFGKTPDSFRSFVQASIQNSAQRPVNHRRGLQWAVALTLAALLALGAAILSGTLRVSEGAPPQFASTPTPAHTEMARMPAAVQKSTAYATPGPPQAPPATQANEIVLRCYVSSYTLNG